MGPLVDGTSGFVDQIRTVADIDTTGGDTGGLSAVDFECGGAFTDVIAEFEEAKEVGFTNYYLAIDEQANIVLLGDEYVEEE